MKKTSLSILLIVALGLSMLSACGGGSSSTSQTPPPPFQPTTAVLTLSTAVTSTIPLGTTINTYNVTILLPDGVTVKTQPASSETDTGVLNASGSATGAMIIGVYTAATGTFPGTVNVTVISSGGLTAGDFCTVNANITAGHYPTASSFAAPTLVEATGFDSSVNTVTLTGQLSLTATAVVH
jgi:hypothetical protein